MQVTYHLVPRAEWEATDPTQPYVPAGFSSEGPVYGAIPRVAIVGVRPMWRDGQRAWAPPA